MTEQNDRPNLWINYANLANILVEQGRLDEALFYVRRSEEIATSIGVLPIGMHSVYYRLGQIYLDERSYINGLEMFRRMLELRQKAGDINLIAEAKNAVGLAHRRLGNLDKATSYANKVFEMIQEHPILLININDYPHKYP